MGGPRPQSPGEFDQVAVRALTEAGLELEEAKRIVATLRAAGVLRSNIEVMTGGLRVVGTNADIRLDNGWEISGRVTRDGQPLVPDKIDWMP